MKKLRILILVMLCSMLVMPVHAAAAIPAIPSPFSHHVTDDNPAPVDIITSATVVTDSEAVIQLDKVLLLPVLQQLLQQLYLPGTGTKPVLDYPAFVLRANGLHIIFTAGP